MAGLNMPGYMDYGAMMGMNPQAYGQAMDQVGLAQQFQNQNLLQEEQNTLANMMKNDQSRVMNPMLADQQRMTNEGLGLDNITKGVTSRITAQTEDEAKKARRAKLLAEADEDTLKQIMAQGQALSLRTDDPVLKEKGDRMLQDTWGEQQKRQRAKEEEAKARIGAEGRLEGIRYAQEAATGRTQMTIEGQNQRAAQKAQKGATDIMGAVNSGKMTYEKAATSFEVMASMEEDPARAAAFSDLARKFAQANISQKSALAGTKPDLSKLGIETNLVQLGVGGPATRVPGATAAPSGGGTQTERQMLQSTEEPMGLDPKAAQREISTINRDLNDPSKKLTPQERQLLTEQVRTLQGQLTRAGGSAPARPSAPAVPASGEVRGGYRFKGGNPADKANWEKV